MAKFALIHLSLLLLSSFTLLANGFNILSWTLSTTHSPAAAPAPHLHKGGHHHMSQPPVHSPSHLPVHPPSHSPVHAPKQAHPPVYPRSPAHPPVPAPSHAHSPVQAPMPVRKFVAVQGVVYCKACNYTGVDTLLGATPLLGAVVKLQCNNTKYYPMVQQATTDKNGYFFTIAPKTLTTYASHKCKVTLLSSPMATCNQPTNLHYGINGAILVPSITPPVPPTQAPASPPYQVFSVGPFAYEASTTTPCPH